MKFCYLSGGHNVPSVRFRLPFFELLEKRGHRCDLLHGYPSRYDYYRLIGWRCSTKLRQLVRGQHCRRIKQSRYDAVVLETGLFHTDDWRYEAMVRENTSRLVYEIDDAVFLLFPKKIQMLTEMADHVIVANTRIAEWVGQHNSSVSIIPTCVDANLYNARSYEDSDEESFPVVGWIGSSGNVRMLDVCAEALRSVARDRAFQLRVITSDADALQNIDLSGIDIRWIDIDQCDANHELQQFDVGIMPLPDDDPWMEYKCNAKMIQYMATAVPAVGSAIGFNLELVEHGVNSLLAANTDEWTDCLTQLLDSGDLRQRLGTAARQTVLDRFTVQSNIDAYETALQGGRPGQ